MQIQTIADITGTGAAQQLTASVVEAKILSIRAGATNAGSVRFGDSAITSSRGGYLKAGESYDFPSIDDQLGERYNLNQIYVLHTSPDTVSVVYGA